MKTFKFLTLAVTIILNDPAVAQSPAAEVRRSVAQPFSPAATKAKAEALQSFRNGDQTTGLGKVTATIKRGRNAPDEDMQVAGKLAEICALLITENSHARAVEVANLSLTKLSAARTKLKTKEAAASHALSGQLYERILGDPKQAIQAYQQALALDPQASGVSERLTYLKAVEEHAKAKATENELLRQRSAKSKR